MKKIITFLFIASIFFAACNSDNTDKDDPKKIEKEDSDKDDAKEKKSTKTAKMAAEVCDCMNPLIKDLSSDSKKILKKAMESEDVEATTEKELMKLDEDERQDVAEELQKFGNEMEADDSQVTKCMNKLSEKYKEEPEDEEKFIEDLVSDMEEEEDCDISALIFRAYLKNMQKKE